MMVEIALGVWLVGWLGLWVYMGAKESAADRDLFEPFDWFSAFVWPPFVLWALCWNLGALIVWLTNKGKP